MNVIGAGGGAPEARWPMMKQPGGERADDNPYAKPIQGLHAIVDLDEMTVVRVEDLGVVPLPPGFGRPCCRAHRAAARRSQAG